MAAEQARGRLAGVAHGQVTPEAMTRIMLRPLASSLPLAAFSIYGALALLSRASAASSEGRP